MISFSFRKYRYEKNLVYFDHHNVNYLCLCKQASSVFLSSFSIQIYAVFFMATLLTTDSGYALVNYCKIKISNCLRN